MCPFHPPPPLRKQLPMTPALLDARLHPSVRGLRAPSPWVAECDKHVGQGPTEVTGKTTRTELSSEPLQRPKWKGPGEGKEQILESLSGRTQPEAGGWGLQRDCPPCTEPAMLTAGGDPTSSRGTAISSEFPPRPQLSPTKFPEPLPCPHQEQLETATRNALCRQAAVTGNFLSQMQPFSGLRALLMLCTLRTIPASRAVESTFQSPSPPICTCPVRKRAQWPGDPEKRSSSLAAPGCSHRHSSVLLLLLPQCLGCTQ